MAKKLNSMRVLESASVAFEALTYPESIHSADGVADYLGLPRAQVFKTLVVERPEGGKPLLVMLAGDRELDIKKLAAAVGEKKLRMARHADAERLTGLQVGGISALALLNRGFQIYLDQTADELDTIVVSAGQRGVNIKVAVADLKRVTRAQLVEAS